MPTAAARATVRPNAARRAAFRMALQGRSCGTCLLPIAWDGVTVHRAAGSGDLAHTVAVEVCGLYTPAVIFASCHACNQDSHRAGILDVSADVVSDPYDLPSQAVVNAWRATRVQEDATGLPSWQERRDARAARGLAW